MDYCIHVFHMKETKKLRSGNPFAKDVGQHQNPQWEAIGAQIQCGQMGQSLNFYSHVL